MTIVVLVITSTGVGDWVSVADGINDNWGSRVSIFALTIPEHPIIKTDNRNNDANHNFLVFVNIILITQPILSQ